MQFAIGYRRDRNGWKTAGWISLGRCAREMTLLKPQTKQLICGDRSIDGAVRYSGRNRRSPDSAPETSLEGPDIRGIDTNDVSNTPRQDVTEQPKTRAEYRIGCKLPSGRRPRLQDREWCGSE